MRQLGLGLAIAWAVGCVSACVIEAQDVEEDVAFASEEAWSCPGLAGTTLSPTGSYYVTSFGCWVDEDGDPRGDPSDNCIPACKGSAPSVYQELCGTLSGPACERQIGWYAADADRYGCGTRLKVTNPDTGEAAVVVVLDRGPNCKIEKKVSHWVIDLSYPASLYLFGEPKAATERADVQVEVVPPGTPLGPVTDEPDDPPPDEPPPDEPPPDEPPPDDPHEPITVTVDSNNVYNTSEGRCTVSGNWGSSSNVGGYYKTGYWWRSTGATTDPANFEVLLAAPRTMTVEAWWPAAGDRSTTAPFLVYNAAGTLLDTVYKNQRLNGSQWVVIGTYPLTAGWNKVSLSRWTTPGSVVVADAVRFRSAD
jgi:hypothetical protein